MRDFTEEEALPFAEFARTQPFQVRFIEFMPLDGDHAWTPDAVLTGEELRAIIHARYPLEELPREPSATARVFRFADGEGEIGFINPVSEPFCSDCNRIRLTAEGKLRTCLFSLNETDLREPLRSGASDDELETIIRDAVWRKELKHRVGEPGFIQPAAHDERDRRLGGRLPNALGGRDVVVALEQVLRVVGRLHRAQARPRRCVEERARVRGLLDEVRVVAGAVRLRGRDEAVDRASHRLDRLLVRRDTEREQADLARQRRAGAGARATCAQARRPCDAAGTS